MSTTYYKVTTIGNTNPTFDFTNKKIRITGIKCTIDELGNETCDPNSDTHQIDFEKMNKISVYTDNGIKVFINEITDIFGSYPTGKKVGKAVISSSKLDNSGNEVKQNPIAVILEDVAVSTGSDPETTIALIIGTDDQRLSKTSLAGKSIFNLLNILATSGPIIQLDGKDVVVYSVEN
jgi:hypothetical protein